MHCAPEHCHGEAAMILFHTCVASFLTLTASNVAELPCKCAGWWYDTAERLLRAQCLSHQRKQSTSPWLWIWPSSLSAASAVSDSSTEDSHAWSPDRTPKPMTRRQWIIFPKFGSISSCSKMSWHPCTCRSFCSSFSNFGTIFAQIFLIPRSFVMFVHTLSQFMSNSTTIILKISRQSPCTF